MTGEGSAIRAHEIVGRNRARFDAPPALLPAGEERDTGHWRVWEGAGTKVDAPILGNGDMLAAFGGEPQWPQFWVTTNDFWQMESSPWEFFHDNSTAKYAPPTALGSPRPVGRVILEMPALEGASYAAEQDFLTAVTSARFAAPDGCVVELRSWVAALENILVVELTANRPVPVSLAFCFPDELGWGVSYGVDFTGERRTEVSLAGTFVGHIGGCPEQQKAISRGVLSGYRAFRDKVDVPTRVGFAGRFVGEEELPVTVRPGARTLLVLPLRSWAKVSRPYEMARSRARWMTAAEVDRLWSVHTAWWREFWSVSHVELDDPVVEQRYYLSQYVMGSVSRDPDYPPNILGVATFDRPAWNGNYKINYNHQAPYLGLLASGHFEQADTHDAPYLALMDIAKEMSQRLQGHEGVYLPLGMGPAGLVSESLLLHMKSPAAHGATNMGIRWYLTRDRGYALRVYPFLRGVADFWEHNLVERDGRLRIVDDGMHERDEKEIRANGIPENAANSLGYVRSAFRLILDVSEELGIDADKRERWRDILARLSPYPMGSVGEVGSFWRGADDLRISDLLPPEELGTTVFHNEEVGGKWSLSFPGNVMQVYPAGEIGLDSDPGLLAVARNTVRVRSVQERRLAEWSARLGARAADHFVAQKTGAWNDGNISSMFLPAAVRVGHDPEEIWREMRERIVERGLPNGFIRHNPHGIENCGTVPNTVQEMMLLSHENVLRFFRVWPRSSHPDASFDGLWAYGGFVVGARLAAGVVRDVGIRSRRGRPCRVENPWPGRTVRLVRASGEELLSGAVVEFATAEGELVRLELAD